MAANWRTLTVPGGDQKFRRSLNNNRVRNTALSASCTDVRKIDVNNKMDGSRVACKRHNACD